MTDEKKTHDSDSFSVDEVTVDATSVQDPVSLFSRLFLEVVCGSCETQATASVEGDVTS